MGRKAMVIIMIQEWFGKAKLGIFIHWGIYAVNGIAESWSFGRGNISYEDYMKQLEGFTASKFDPQKWAALFREAGARYAVLTSKHHDGVALFDTKYTDLNTVKKTPAGRDLIAPYCKALKEEGLKTGIYFTNTDWSDLDNMQVILDKSAEEIIEMRKEKTDFGARWQEVIAASKQKPIVTPEKEAAWQRFMERYRGEIRELLENYGGVDLLWFDVMLAREGYSWEVQQVREMIQSISPKTVINGRLVGAGDYFTPELYIPLRAPEGPWELCTTFNDSWGYQPHDRHFKDIRQIVRMFVECISKGGNMLISVGPDPEGAIPPEVEAQMKALGRWTHQYEEAIYEPEKGIGTEYFAGGTTLSEDKQTLYLFVYDKPYHQVMLNGIRNNIRRITSLKNGRELSWSVTGGASWVNMPGCIWIETQEEDLDDVCTVLKVELEGSIDLVELEGQDSSVGEN